MPSALLRCAHAPFHLHSTRTTGTFFRRAKESPRRREAEHPAPDGQLRAARRVSPQVEVAVVLPQIGKSASCRPSSSLRPCGGESRRCSSQIGHWWPDAASPGLRREQTTTMRINGTPDTYRFPQRKAPSAARPNTQRPTATAELLAESRRRKTALKACPRQVLRESLHLLVATATDARRRRPSEEFAP